MAKIKTSVNDTRVKKLADYLLNIINEILIQGAKDINVNSLSKNVNSYSLDKIPTESTVTKFIDGSRECRDVYDFKSRMEYSVEQINNILNIGFYETLEDKIYSNNNKGILPNIEKIISIECLNAGTVNNVGTNTCEMSIQIQITYLKEA